MTTITRSADHPQRTCPRCGGSGAVDLSRSELAVLAILRERRHAMLTTAIAGWAGLTLQRVNGVLHELELVGLARRLPGRTADGYEWEARATTAITRSADHR